MCKEMDVRGNELDVLEAGELALRITGDEPVAELTEEVDKVCAAAEDHAGAATVVLWLGAPSHDRGAWLRGVDVQRVNRWERAVRRVERLAAVTIAVAGGRCGGPALDLLLATDHRIALADFRLVPPVHDGQFWPGMAVHRLANQLGAARARRLVLRPQEIHAQAAVDLGLVDEIAVDPHDRARAASVLLGGAGTEFAIRRGLLLDAPTTPFDDALGSHLAACDRELRRLRRPADGGNGR